MLSNELQMKLHRISLTIFVGLTFSYGADAQAKTSGDKTNTLFAGIVNGKATYLPKPIYSDEAKRYCADGKVEVEVLIDENGSVKSANAISGDKLLQESSVTAAKAARFFLANDMPPIIFKGIVIYNFDSLSKCLKGGVVNKKAISIPKPNVVGNILSPSHTKLTVDSVIDVNIVVDPSGNVISARATSGHPLVRNAFERSAIGAKFYPTPYVNINVKAVIRYVVKPNGEIEY